MSLFAIFLCKVLKHIVSYQKPIGGETADNCSETILRINLNLGEHPQSGPRKRCLHALRIFTCKAQEQQKPIGGETTDNCSQTILRINLNLGEHPQSGPRKRCLHALRIFTCIAHEQQKPIGGETTDNCS